MLRTFHFDLTISPECEHFLNDRNNQILLDERLYFVYVYRLRLYLHHGPKNFILLVEKKNLSYMVTIYVFKEIIVAVDNI